MRSLLRTLVNAVITIVITALAFAVVVTLIPGVELIAAPNDAVPGVGATNEPGRAGVFIAVSVIFILVNSTIMPILRIIGLPLTCITLGLFSLILNAAALFIVSWVLDVLPMDLGSLQISGWWAAIFAAIVLSLASSLIGALVSPLVRRF